MKYATSNEAYAAYDRYNKIELKLIEAKESFSNNTIDELTKAKKSAEEAKSKFEKAYQSNSTLRSTTVKKMYDLNSNIDNAIKQLNNIISTIDSNIAKCDALCTIASNEMKYLQESEKNWFEKLIT